MSPERTLTGAIREVALGCRLFVPRIARRIPRWLFTLLHFFGFYLYAKGDYLYIGRRQYTKVSSAEEACKWVKYNGPICEMVPVLQWRPIFWSPSRVSWDRLEHENLTILFKACARASLVGRVKIRMVQ